MEERKGNVANVGGNSATIMDQNLRTYTSALEILCHQVIGERAHQDAKWGRSFPGRTDDRWLTILTEEVGECANAILSGEESALEKEIIQVAAVCLSWLELRVSRSEQIGEGRVE